MWKQSAFSHFQAICHAKKVWEAQQTKKTAGSLKVTWFIFFGFLFTPFLTKNMSRHMRELHNKEVDNENNSSVTDLEKKPNKCSVCDKKFKYERNVARHMKNVHAESA